jgi:putative heme-binding domain-containing protein
MSRIVCQLAFVAHVMWIGTTAAQQPQWIWQRDTTKDVRPASGTGETCRLERTFEVDQRARSAGLRFAADFCDATVTINGRQVASVEAYSPTVDVDVAAALKTGQNRMAIVAQAVGRPAAVALGLSLAAVDGQKHEIVTDEQWRVERSGDADRPATKLGAVAPALWGIGRRPATIDPFDNYEQWRQAIGTPAVTDRSAFWTAPGFDITLVRQAQPDEGSWVSMAFDPRGRLTIAREDKGLLRMTLDAERRAVEQVEMINDELQECRGLLYAYDALYANANNSKALYRLRDTDGDERFDEVRRLREFPGSVGHGRNDLALGPDGLIYSIHGDAVDVPKADIIDYTSPFREAHHDKNTREGHLLRTDRDGKQWELLAAGLRNPFGIAFNAAGDLFTYDADAEFDMGSPWYRPTRVDQLVSGADFGWRGVTGKWPPYFPDHADNALPTLDIGKGSPTAVAFGTGTRFPADYRDALFILDWAYGRILAVHLAPRGGGYRARAETFLKGRPLNVTDLAVGPDGALWIVTGGRKTQSALYRIVYAGKSGEAELSAHEQACQKQAATMRAIRIELEARHRPLDDDAVRFAWPHLDSPDPSIRCAARIAIEHQPPATWRERALHEDRPTAALTALSSVVRSGDKEATSAALERLVHFRASDLTVGQALMLVQCYFLCRDHMLPEVHKRKDVILAQLDAVFPHPAAQSLHVSRSGTGASLNREVARLLAQIGSPSIVDKVTNSLLQSSGQEDRLHGLFVLRDVRTGWSGATRRAYFTALNEASSLAGGEGMPRFLAQIREQAMATLTDGDRKLLAELLSPPAAASDEPLPPARPLIRHWKLEDLAAPQTDTIQGGDPTRGAIVFRDALCSRCHRSGARGPAVGPDLTHVAGRFSRRDILESILNPSKVVAENYRNVQISTTDGRQIVGRVAIEGDFRSEKLRIATEPLRSSVTVELSKRDIAEYREIDTSPMPQGLLDSFSRENILDLLVFLESGGQPIGSGQ